MAVNAYLLIDGVPGPSTSLDKAIDILSFSFGSSNSAVFGPGSSGGESRAGRGRKFIGSLPGQLRALAVQRRGFIFEMVFRENDARAAESIGLDDVRAGFEIRAVNIQNYIGPRAHQHFIAAFERRAAEIRGGEIFLLHHGAHGAIEEHDARCERVEYSLAALGSVCHLWNFTLVPLKFRCARDAEPEQFAQWCLLGFGWH